MNDSNTRAASLAKLRDLIQGIHFAQLTTVEPNGHLRSRPMATQEVEFDGDLWFFTSRVAGKINEIQKNPQVNVSYAAPDKNRFVSVSGLAQQVDDRAKLEGLWRPGFKIWFPDGLNDPDITLLKIEVAEVEYWDAPSSKFVQLFGFVKALTTGNHDSLGKMGELDLRHSVP